MKTCFLLTHVPDPKTNKRIKVFKEYGETSIICTRRSSQDIWEPAFDDVRHYIFKIDLPTEKHIARRAFVSNQYQREAKKKLNEIKPDVIYAESMDSLLIASDYKKYHRVKVFYDVADLRETYIDKPVQPMKRIINNIIKTVEKRCFRNVDYLVITSKKFYSVYYHKLIEKEKVIYIPNAPDKDIFDGYVKKSEGEFTVGFIGGIRYIEQMKMLVDAAGICGFKVLFAGAGGTTNDYDKILKYCRNKNYIHFTGKYDYKSEIAGLYSQVDCVYAVYDADNSNVRIALPNKLYESVLCCLPIIVAKGTYLSEVVKKWGVGLSVDHNNVKELVEALKSIRVNRELNEQIENACRRHATDCRFDTYEWRLRNAIEEIK